MNLVGLIEFTAHQQQPGGQARSARRRQPRLGRRQKTCKKRAMPQVHCQPKRMVASRQLKYSCGFLKGCMAGVPSNSHGGFHFLLFFSPHLFRVPGHAPSVVTSKPATFDTPLSSMHICAKRSSPMGPHLVPFTQSILWLQLSMLLTSVLKASAEKTSRFPKKPYSTDLQFSM